MENTEARTEASNQETAPLTFSERLNKPKEIQRGWIDYFRMANIQAKLKEQDSWLRNQLRYCIGKTGRNPAQTKKYDMLSGSHNGQAYAWSRTRMKGGAVAQRPILITTITLERLVKRGYESMLSHYKNVSLQFHDRVYETGSAYAELRRKHTYSCHAVGLMRYVRGAPHR